MESKATPQAPQDIPLADDPIFEQVRQEVARIGRSHDHALLDRLLGELDTPIVFVDLETTGGNVLLDRITEIGLVEISRTGVDTWTSLVDPEQPIPPFIQDLTGISNEMVRGQPVFAALADALAARLEGKLFVAHNARFDYGFLQRSFERAGIRFEADMLCTVQLSRALFPSVARHGLTALIERFSLEPLGRHRALADADLIWQFWQVIHTHHPVERIQRAISSLTRRNETKGETKVDTTEDCKEDLRDETPQFELTGEHVSRGGDTARAPVRARTPRRAAVAPVTQLAFEWDEADPTAGSDSPPLSFRE